MIRMSFPADSGYILAVRLAVSAVAEQMGFNMDDIEDIKEVSTEGCNILFSCHPESVNISMTVQEDALDMDIRAKAFKESTQNSEEELSEYLLETLADECSFTRQGEMVTGVHFRRKCR